MKSTLFILFMGFLLFAETLFAQTKKSNAGINLSIWKNVATQPTDTVGGTLLNVGLYSSINKLNGLAINVLGNRTYRQANGILFSGLFNYSGLRTSGLQVSGITNVVGRNLYGISASGVVNIIGANQAGISFGGLTNLVGANSKGIQLSGLTNITGGNAKGIQLSGLANVTGQEASGIQFSGLANVVGKQAKGIQVSGLCNIVGDSLIGAQFSLVNVTVKGKGLQVGLVNYYHQRFDGLQLGLINLNPLTKVQPLAYIGTGSTFNVGIRFKNPLFYTILGTGLPYMGFDEKFSASLFYRAGIEAHLSGPLYLSGDIGFQHVESFKNKEHGYPKRYYALQPRLNVECHLNENLSVFVTGGYSWDKPYEWGHCIKKQFLLEAGIVLLRN